MERYAILENGVVSNVVLWDGKTEWGGAEQAVLCPDEVNIGDRYEDGQFIPAEPE
jgi:hypothetical protein